MTVSGDQRECRAAGAWRGTRAARCLGRPKQGLSPTNYPARAGHAEVGNPGTGFPFDRLLHSVTFSLCLPTKNKQSFGFLFQVINGYEEHRRQTAMAACRRVCSKHVLCHAWCMFRAVWWALRPAGNWWGLDTRSGECCAAFMASGARSGHSRTH